MHRFSWLLVAAAVLVILSGCRSYGGRYGVEEATYRQIAPAIEDLDAELQRVRSLPNVDQIFPQDEPALRAEGLVTSYGALVEGYRARYEEMSPSSSHRDLSRFYRAIVTDYHTLRAARQRAEQATTGELVDAPTGVTPPTPYTIRPAFYERLEGGSPGMAATAATPDADLDIADQPTQADANED